MNKPRLFVLTECYPRPSAPGMCAFAHRQLIGVAEAGWDVRVLIPNGWFPPVFWRLASSWREARMHGLPAGWSLDGIRIEELRYQNRVPSRWSRPLAASDRIAESLRTYLRHSAEVGRDVLLVQFALPYGSIARDVVNTLRIPYAIMLRGDDVWVWPHRNESARRAFTHAVSGAGMVFAVAEALLKGAEELSGTTLPGAVVPNGIDLGLFRPPADDAERRSLRADLGLRPDDIAIVTVADPLERKGWRELLQALAMLRQNGLPVVGVGVVGGAAPDIDLAGEAATWAPNLSLVLRRGLRGDGVARVLRAADVFALPSHWEGIANALLEAMASGLPVVTTDVAGHPEVITSGEEGLLVPPRDAAALTEALADLCRDAGKRGRMGRTARSRTEAIGDSRTNGARLATLLDCLRAGRPVLDRTNPYRQPRVRVTAGR